MSALQTLESLRGLVATLEAEKAAAVAKAERLESENKRLSEGWIAEHDRNAAVQEERDAPHRKELTNAHEDIERLNKELSRYQRADVPERVRALQSVHDHAIRVSIATRGHVALMMSEHNCGELLDIVRQQQVRIEEQAAEIKTLNGNLTATGAMLGRGWEETHEQAALRVGLERVWFYHRARAWKRCAKRWRDHAVSLRADKALLKLSLRAYEGDTDKVPRVDEPLGAAESLPKEAGEPTFVRIPILPIDPEADRMVSEVLNKAWAKKTRTPIEPAPAKGDEFRPGLPPLALREEHEEWESSEGAIYSATKEGWFGHHWDKDDDPVAYEYTGNTPLRPHGKTRAEVEILAAKMLGERDAREGRMRCWDDLASALFEKGPIADWPDIHSAWEQYAAAYDAAKGG